MKADREPPDSPDLADEAAAMRGAYVHIPFCAVRCPYCDFAVVEGDVAAGGYLRALAAEIEAAEEWHPLDAVSFGGGTPSLIGADALADVIRLISARFGLVEGAEVSLEANPEDWTSSMARRLVDSGFNRVSFGAQSWDSQVLDNLGRRHRPADTDRVIREAREAGFRSVSVDLMFGEPAESDASWHVTLDRAIGTGVDHVSTYGLTVEPGTALFRSIRDGAAAPDDDTQADRYEIAVGKLREAGFVRYEVSNHARPGHACRYNLIVWSRGEYLGFGMGAHGFRGGRRIRNARVLGEYLDRVERSGSAVVGTEQLSGEEAERERLFVGLRRAAGVALDDAARALLGSDEGRRLLEAGLISQGEDRLRVVNPLLTDTVARAVLG